MCALLVSASIVYAMTIAARNNTISTVTLDTASAAPIAPPFDLEDDLAVEMAGSAQTAIVGSSIHPGQNPSAGTHTNYTDPTTGFPVGTYPLYGSATR
jgi:hypothetical protein